jgi:ribosomal protein S18 acetylase RimI-like enzyme
MLSFEKARTRDAEQIYRLKAEAFRSSYLRYTIYRSPKSVSYLRNLIRSGQVNEDLLFLVARESGRLAAYFHANQQPTGWFLNYIAVSEESRGSGLGKRMLAAFENAGRDRGCVEAEMDVFESNVPAMEWYKSAGYSLVGEKTLCEIDLERIAPGGSIDADDLVVESALKVEEEQGFSNFSATLRGRPMRIGLINGDTCKLLETSGVTVAEVAAALRSLFQDSRRFLIVDTVPIAKMGCKPASQDKLLRLRKEIA